MSDALIEPPVTIIESGGASRDYWVDLWRHRELIAFLTWRDIVVRYKQTLLGIAWVILRPAITIVIFTLVFGRIAGLPSQGAPYALIVFGGLLPWNLFSSALSETSGSLFSNSSLLTKIYFPRLIIPISSISVCLLDFLVTGVLIIPLLMIFRHPPALQILAFPLFLVLTVAVSFGLGLWIAALSMRFRDIRQVMPYLIQMGMYASPVGYTSSVIPENWRTLYYLNPMVSIIDGFRWCLLGDAFKVSWGATLYTGLVSLILVASGIVFFRKSEAFFAEKV